LIKICQKPCLYIVDTHRLKVYSENIKFMSFFFEKMPDVQKCRVSAF